MHKQRTDTLAELENLSPVPPPPAVRSALLERTHGPDRYLPFANRLTTLLDLGHKEVVSLLRMAAGNDAWVDGPVPGFSVMHISPGPQVTLPFVGFARLPQGYSISDHGHVHDERIFVLEGLLQTSDGASFGPGQCMHQAPGTRHAVQIITACTVTSVSGEITQ